MYQGSGSPKKDLTKLVRKQIVDKNGHRKTVWVKLSDEKEEDKKSIFSGIFSFFNLSGKNDAEKKISSEYKKNNIKSYGIDETSWKTHFVEYFKNKVKWDNLFKSRIAKEEKIKVSNKQAAKQTVINKIKNDSRPKWSGKIMKKIFNLYGGENGQNTPGLSSGRVSTDKQEIPGTQTDRHTGGDVPAKQPGDNRKEPVLNVSQPGERPVNDVRLTKKQIKEIRQEVKNLLDSKKDSEFTEEDKALLRQYEGAGGLGESDSTTHGTLYEFYTPKTVIDKMWSLVKKYTGDGKKDVLEPSAGTGRFADGKEHNFDMFEIDTTSARINRILNPEQNVNKKAFQELFFKKGVRQKNYEGKKYDVVIGNPPYGAYQGIHKGKGEGADHKRYEEYFIDRGLDTLKEGGVMAFIVPSSFMRSWNNSKIKEKLSKKGRLLEAYRLPNGTFSTTGVGTDVIILRKEKGNINDFIGDGYFKNNPTHVMGDETTRTGKYGAEKYVSPKDGHSFDDAISNIDIKKIPAAEYNKPSLSEEVKQKISAGLKGNKNAEKLIHKEPKKESKTKFYPNNSKPVKKKTHSIEEFSKKYHKKFDKFELDVWKATTWDGKVDIDKIPSENRKLFQSSDAFCRQNGVVYHKANYASGDIYNKLSILEQDKESLGEKKYKYQKELLLNALPEKKTIKNITISPISDYAKNFNFFSGDEKESLINKFFKWSTGDTRGYFHYYNVQSGKGNVTPHDLPGVLGWRDIYEYIKQVPVRAERASFNNDKGTNKLLAESKKELRREAAEKLFKRFLESGLSKEEKENLEKDYNYKFNSYVAPDYSQIPIFVDGISQEFKGKELVVKDIQLKGASFLCNKGNGILAYDVGVGKTMTGILATINQLHTGRAKKPVVCVPKAVYNNWIDEIKDLFPDTKINELGNLGESYVKKFRNKEGAVDIPEGALNIMTYEALQNLTFKDESVNDTLLSDIMDSQVIDDPDKKDRERQLEKERVMTKLGQGTKVKSNAVFIEDLGIDHITIDEVHNFKNVFGGARPQKVKGQQTANEFQDLSGGQSDRAMKMFALTQYIQKNNNNRNVFALSATPFTNSPLEIYNILSLVARQRLKELGIYNLHEFMARFAKLKSEWVSTTKGTVERKSVMKEFQNLSGLQALIQEYIDKVDGEEAGVVRPNKKTHLVELPMSLKQKEIFEAEQERMAEVSKENPGAVLKGINNMRMSTLSPDFVNDEDGNKTITSNFIEDSPKLKFTFDSVAKVYGKRKDLGQVIYMPRGISTYSSMVKYLVKKGIPEKSIGCIYSGVSSDKVEKIKKSFNDPDGEIKVLIGSETIQEGINLNGNSAVLYNTLLGWNPSERTQVEGRIWRQGNKQENVHIVYPQIVDSIDSAMYQKHDEKSQRFNALWSYKGDSLNVESINAEDLKFDLIKDPKRKADFRISLEVESIDGQKRDKRIFVDMLKKYKSDYSNYESYILYWNNKIKTQEKYVKEIQVDYDKAVEKFKSISSKNKDEKELAKRNADREKDGLSRLNKELSGSQKELKVYESKKSDLIEKLGDMGTGIDTIPDKIQEVESEIDALVEKEKEINSNRDKYIKEAEELIRKNQKQVPSVSQSIDNYVNLILNDVKYKEAKTSLNKSLSLNYRVVSLNGKKVLISYPVKKVQNNNSCVKAKGFVTDNFLIINSRFV